MTIAKGGRTITLAPDDHEFLKHSLAYQGEHAPTIGYKDVALTRWPPGERTYGRD